MTLTEESIQLVGHGSGNPSIKKSMKSYLSSRYSGTASISGVSKSTWDGIPQELKDALGMTYSGGTATWHKGLICVLEPVGLNDANGKKAHDLYKTCLGRNYYTNSSKRQYVYTPCPDNGLYYSDCSSSVTTCHHQTVNSSIGCLNTVGMMISKYYKKVEGIIVKNGHITEGLEQLRTGMALMFAGKDWGRLAYSIVGHVEMVYQMTDGTLMLDSNMVASATSTSTSSAFKTYMVKVNVSSGSTLNIRKEANDTSQIVGYLKPTHRAVTIRSEKNGWGQVYCKSDKDGKEVWGWIYLKYTKKV